MRLAALAVLALSMACESTSNGQGYYLHTDIFEDIPAPRGVAYKHAKHESFAYRSRTFRCGKFLFEWKGPQTECVRFYRETMTAPPYSWTLTEENTPGTGSTQLVFVKGYDRCSVEIDHVPQNQALDNNSIVVRVNYRG
jgi:hypothetical protein